MVQPAVSAARTAESTGRHAASSRRAAIPVAVLLDAAHAAVSLRLLLLGSGYIVRGLRGLGLRILMMRLRLRLRVVLLPVGLGVVVWVLVREDVRLLHGRGLIREAVRMRRGVDVLSSGGRWVGEEGELVGVGW
jgi:hypothetical protein